MPVNMQLTDDGNIIIMEYVDPWTVAELLEQNNQQQVWLNAASHKLQTLVDLTRTRQIPTGVLRVREAPLLKHPNSGQMAAIGASSRSKSEWLREHD